MPLKILATYKAKDLMRKRYCIDHRHDNTIIIEGNRFINFCSNDYLGLSGHPAVKEAFIQGIKNYGAGSSGSPLVSGYYHPHALLEEQFAHFLNRDQAVLFNSGYHANLGIISTLANRHSHIIADKLCHNSLLTGIQLSRAKYHRYPHQNIRQLQKLLDKLPATTSPMLLITESIFSMEGDISPVQQLSALAKSYNCLFILDDAHGFGVLGNQGGGICEQAKLTQEDVPCIVVPLGKALGNQGAIVAGKKAYIETLIQCSKAYLYSSALPPAAASAALAALNILQKETWRREKLHANITHFIAECHQRNLKLHATEKIPIQCIRMNDNKIALHIKEKLMQAGFFTACIRPPTVPQGTTRLKIVLNALHTKNEISALLDALFHINHPHADTQTSH